MNRNEEYLHILAELEAEVPSMEPALTKARKRRARKRMICRPLASLAAVFIAFVLLVNFSAPVANACSRIPILRELAEAVTFSRSLSDAVNNEYAQVIDQKQTVNGITAEIEYVIADRNRIYVFFRLDSPQYSELSADALMEWDEITKAHGYRRISREYGFISFSEIDNGLRLLRIDHGFYDIPVKFDLTLQVFDGNGYEGEYFWDWSEAEHEYLAEITFSIEIDPELIGPTKTYHLDQPLELDGQKFTVEKIDVYPTGLYMTMVEDANNAKSLRALDFYIEINGNDRFDKINSGAASTSFLDSGNILSFEAESTYFYDAEDLKIVVTKALFVEKEEHSFYVDLSGGKAEDMPEGMELIAVEKDGLDWHITVNSQQVDDFEYVYWDYDTQYHISMDIVMPSEDNGINEPLDVLRLKEYADDEIWISYKFRHLWTAENPIVIPVE